MQYVNMAKSGLIWHQHGCLIKLCDFEVNLILIAEINLWIKIHEG